MQVNSRSQGSNPYILSYGSETLLVNKYSDAENCQRQFKVIRGQFQNSEFNRLTYSCPLRGTGIFLQSYILVSNVFVNKYVQLGRNLKNMYDFEKKFKEEKNMFDFFVW